MTHQPFHKSLDTKQEKNTQNIITKKAQGKAYFVFVTPTEEKYIPKIYTMVSELPIITAAQKAGKLFAPVLSIRDEKDAIDALPEKGLVISRVKSSEGIPRRTVMGSISSPIASSTPDADSILTPTIIATRDGMSPNETEIPSFAPVLNESNPTFLPKSKMMATTPITSGTENAAIFSIINICSIFSPSHKHGKEKEQKMHSLKSISI